MGAARAGPPARGRRRGWKKSRRHSEDDDDGAIDDDALDDDAAAAAAPLLAGIILLALALDIGAVVPDGRPEEQATGVTREERSLAQKKRGIEGKKKVGARLVDRERWKMSDFFSKICF